MGKHILNNVYWNAHFSHSEEIRDVPLGKLSLLREEMSTMTKNILILSGSSNYLRALNILLARIVAQVSDF